MDGPVPVGSPGWTGCALMERADVSAPRVRWHPDCADVGSVECLQGCHRFRIGGENGTLHIGHRYHPPFDQVALFAPRCVAGEFVHVFTNTGDLVDVRQFDIEVQRSGDRVLSIRDVFETRVDTLDPEGLKRLMRFGTLAEIEAGIAAAEAAGLVPIKLNSVVPVTTTTRRWSRSPGEPSTAAGTCASSS